jgi:hypothetical protein
MTKIRWTTGGAARVTAALSLALFAGAIAIPNISGGQQRSAGAADCTFQNDPESFLTRESRALSDAQRRARLLDGMRTAARNAPRAVSAADIVRVNFIDQAVFDALQKAGIRPAPTATDEEFVRRIYFDLTGRLPSPAQIRDFAASTDPARRTALIDKLLYSPEFMDKWAMWLGDLLQISTVSSYQALVYDGRNAMQGYLKNAVATDKSLKDLVFEILTAKTGDTTDYSVNNTTPGYELANWIYMHSTPGGPIQDTYDTMFSKSASMFLGLGHYDCVLCHNGRGHLDQLSLWGKGVTRLEAERLSAFFSRVRFARQGNTALANYNTWKVYDVLSGSYGLGTTYGNRPNRPTQGTTTSLTPDYRGTGVVPKNNDWRGAFAASLTADPMFAKNFANRIWQKIFNLGLVEPVDMLDPSRLDAANPPPDPWTLQTPHTVLLDQLAFALADSNFSLHEYIRLLVSSSAYQLSSRYDGDWSIDYVPLFARHYPRRLDGEEIHDAIQIATGVFNRYTVQGWADPVLYAMQLPEPTEPRSNSAAAAFMNFFLRGNRDTAARSQSGSVVQQLALMNDAFVANRVRVSASPVLATLAKMSGDEATAREIWLTFLSRQPNDEERVKAVAILAKANTAALRQTAVEDLAWVCINKMEFIFSY